MWNDRIARAVNQLKLTQPKGAKYEIVDNDDFLVLRLDSEALYRMHHDQKIAAIQWFIKVQKAIEGEGGVVVVLRTPIDDPDMQV